MIEYLCFFFISKRPNVRLETLGGRVLHTKTVDVCVNAHRVSFKSHQIR